MAESSFKAVPVRGDKNSTVSRFKAVPVGFNKPSSESSRFRAVKAKPGPSLDDLTYVPGDTDQGYAEWKAWMANRDDQDFTFEDALEIGGSMVGELWAGGKALAANVVEGEARKIVNSIGEGVLRGTADLGIIYHKAKKKLTRDEELTRERFRGWRSIRKLEAMREKARLGEEDLIDHLALSEDPDAFGGYSQTGDVDVDTELAEGTSYVADIGTVAGAAARVPARALGKKLSKGRKGLVKGGAKVLGKGMQKVGDKVEDFKSWGAEKFPTLTEKAAQAKNWATVAGMTVDPYVAGATRAGVEIADRVGGLGSALTKAAEDFPDLPTNVGASETVSKNTRLTEGTRQAASKLRWADKPLRFGKDALKGAGAGGLVGSGLSLASADTEAEFWSGTIGGTLTGGVGGVAGRTVDILTGRDDAARMQGSIQEYVKNHEGSSEAVETLVRQSEIDIDSVIDPETNETRRANEKERQDNATLKSAAKSALENIVTASEVLKGRVKVRVLGAEEFAKEVGGAGADGFYSKEKKEIVINAESFDPNSTLLHEVGEAMWDANIIDVGEISRQIEHYYGNKEDLKRGYAKSMLQKEVSGPVTAKQIDERVADLNKQYVDDDDWIVRELFAEQFMAETQGPGLHNYVRNHGWIGKAKRVVQAAGRPLGNEVKLGRDGLSKAWAEAKATAYDVMSQVKGGKGIDGLGYMKKDEAGMPSPGGSYDNIFGADLSPGKPLSKSYRKYARELDRQYKAIERGDEPKRSAQLDSTEKTVDWDGVGKEYFDDAPSKAGGGDAGAKDKSKPKTRPNNKKAKSRKEIKKKIRERRKAVKGNTDKTLTSSEEENVTWKPKYTDEGKVDPNKAEFRGKHLQSSYSDLPEMENFRGTIDEVNKAIAEGRVLRSYYFGTGTRSQGDTWVNSLTKDKGNIPVTEVDYLPHEWFVSGPGNIIVRAVDLNYVRSRVNRWKDTDKLKNWNNDVDAFLEDTRKYLANHREGKPGKTGLSDEKHNIINAFFQAHNKGINPFYSAWDRDSGSRIYKSLRLERIGSIKSTNAKGTPFGMGPFDHLKVKRMLSPSRDQAPSDSPVAFDREGKPIFFRGGEIPNDAGPVMKRVSTPDDKSLQRIEELKQYMYSSKAKKLYPSSFFEEDKLVAVRIDIPTFTSSAKVSDDPVYAITVHEPNVGEKKDRVGPVIGYTNITGLTDVRFSVREGEAKKIFDGERTKSPIAVAEGNYRSVTEVPADIESWTQVAMNPRRHSFYYDRATGRPVKGGDEAIIFGGTVFVKNPKYFEKSDRHLYSPSRGQAYPDLGLTSKAEEVTKTLKQHTGSGAQFASMLKKAGVKEEELEVTGLAKLLKDNTRLTKDDILAHLTSNRLDIREDVLTDTANRGWRVSGPEGYEFFALESDANNAFQEGLESFIDFAVSEARIIHDDDGGIRVEAGRGVSDWMEFKSEQDVLDVVTEAATDDYNQEYTVEEVIDADAPGAVRHSHWKEPGGENYQERLIILDDRQRFGEWEGEPHFEQDNIVAHTRHVDRETDTGQQVLFLEELQSDIHQKGREEGYTQELTAKEDAELDLLNERFYYWGLHNQYSGRLVHVNKILNPSTDVDWVKSVGGEDVFSTAGKRRYEGEKLRLKEDLELVAEKIKANDLKELTATEKLRRSDLKDKANSSGPRESLPFKKTWPDLLMRRMLSYAADNGYRYLSWTIGDQQARRYDLSKHASKLEYNPDTNELAAYGKSRLHGNRPRRFGHVTPDQLADHIGKEAASKLLEQPKKGGVQTLEGDDLKVGGAGMRGFYDKILPTLKLWKQIRDDNGKRLKPERLTLGDGTDSWSVKVPKSLEGKGGSLPMFSPARGDVFARSLEEIQSRIPPSERFKGRKEKGLPVKRPNGGRYLSAKLGEKVGGLGLTQAKISQSFQEAINESGTAARKAIEILREEGFDMKPPEEAHWKSAESRPNRDRFWYETSSEAMGISFPDHKGNDLAMVMDMIAATSPLADPNYNSELAISIMSEAARNEPSTTPAVVQKSVADVFSGEFGKAEARKVGSFGQTFKFLYGLLDNPPLPTNDRQVAASFGIPDAAFGRFPVLYEVVTRWFNKARDHVNSHRGPDKDGPFQSFQLQAISWVQTRAESRLGRLTNITEEDAFQGDAYANAFKRAADRLRKAGVKVDKDKETGLPLFTKSTLSDPKVLKVLAPLASKFRKNKFGTVQVETLLHENGERLSSLMRQAKEANAKTAITIGDAAVRRGMNRLMQRETVSGEKLPSPITRLLQAMTGEVGEITRLEMGRATFDGSMERNIRIPMNKVPEGLHEAFLAYLGEPYRQHAQAATKVEPTDGVPDSYSVFVPRLKEADINLQVFAEHLAKLGHEANISQRPNGVVIDIDPQVVEGGTKAPDRQGLKDILDEAFPDFSPQITGVAHKKTYIERPDYKNAIKDFERQLKDEYVRKIQEAAGSSRAVASNLLRGKEEQQEGKGKVRNRSKVEKLRAAYEARIRNLQSIVKQLRTAAKDLEKDLGLRIPDIEKKLGYDRPKNILPGINVRNEAEFPFADQIVSGAKTIETRDTNSLGSVVGQRVKIIRTGQGKAQVIGEATIGKPKVYNDAEAFERDAGQHLVGEGSAFSFKGQKYGYPIIDPVKYKYPYPAPSNRGIVIAKKIRGTRFSPVRQLNSRGGATYQNGLGYRAVQTSSRAGVRVYTGLGKRVGPVFGSIEKAERHLELVE